LSQYAWPRLVAAHLGFAFHAPPLPDANLATYVAGAEHEQPVEYLSDFNDVVVHADRVLQNRKPRKLVMEGHFQQAGKYVPYRDYIRRWEWGGILPGLPMPAGYDAELDVAVHLRLSDYVSLGWNLPASYYRRALRILKPVRSAWVFTDDANGAVPYLEAMRGEAERADLVRCGNPITEFRMMLSCARLVVGNSTYSWWAAFLGDPVVVYPHNWQPWGVSQPGDNHHSPGTLYPSDFRVDLPGWTMIDLKKGCQ
jgi:hypothetical protein